jgi:DNA segregation ATPase FtsK/SpoIIIE-like protein
MPLIDVWAVLTDPDIPSDVGQRLLTRQRARQAGVDAEPCPEADKPYLARHVVDPPTPVQGGAQVIPAEIRAEIADHGRLVFEAAHAVVRSRRVTKEALQRRMRIGFAKASRLLDLLERCGLVGPVEPRGGRPVLVTAAELPALLEELGVTRLPTREDAP